MEKNQVHDLGVYMARRRVEEELCKLGYECNVQPYFSGEQKFSGVVIRMHPSIKKLDATAVVEIARKEIQHLLQPNVPIPAAILTETGRITATVYAK